MMCGKDPWSIGIEVGHKPSIGSAAVLHNVFGNGMRGARIMWKQKHKAKEDTGC